MFPSVAAHEATTPVEYFNAALRKSWGGIANGSKLLARRIGTNARTAANLIEGRNAPSFDTLIKLMKHDDAVFEAVLQLAERNLPPSHEQLKAIKAAIAIMEGKS